MSALVQRRRRIAKIRGIEKRIAELALANATRELKHIESVVDRLAALKSDLRQSDVVSTGAVLASYSEMITRLDRASSATSKPLAAAIDRRLNVQSANMQAHQKCEGADRLLQKSSEIDAREDERRMDANRIARRPDPSEGIAS